jgi:hypothetical protein
MLVYKQADALIFKKSLLVGKRKSQVYKVSSSILSGASGVAFLRGCLLHDEHHWSLSGGTIAGGSQGGGGGGEGHGRGGGAVPLHCCIVVEVDLHTRNGEKGHGLL